MATYDDVKAEHQTLSSTTADTVKLTQWWDSIEVINKSSNVALYFSQTATPTSAAPGTEYVAPGSSIIVPARVNPDGVPGSTNKPCHTVQVVGNGNAYGVVGVVGR